MHLGIPHSLSGYTTWSLPLTAPQPSWLPESPYVLRNKYPWRPTNDIWGSNLRQVHVSDLPVGPSGLTPGPTGPMMEGNNPPVPIPLPVEPSVGTFAQFMRDRGTPLPNDRFANAPLGLGLGFR